ncbi:hypothetical protein Taro_043721 [Colocasia esculenta]|uniref:Uncharacterized protein n=1 Tax=Colocasia esculenta TaxID=4460 RepID=A0A843WH65_COLES|nr:hypothetical protein [Colocasia esculenta]
MFEVQGGSACGPSTLWRSEVVVLVVRHSFSRGCSMSLVVTPSCSFPTSWRSGMLGACVMRLRSYVVAPMFCELLYLGGCVPRCCFRIVLSPLGPSVSYRRVLLLLLGARATSVVDVFARSAVGFVFGLRVRVGVSRRLREPACGVAFTGAGLFPVDPGVVLCSVGIFAQAKKMLVCRVAPLVERCDTCLWLLPDLCWLVLNPGEVFPEFFSVGSSGGEVSPELPYLGAVRGGTRGCSSLTLWRVRGAGWLYLWALNLVEF